MISRVKFILFCSLTIFVNSLRAIVRTVIRLVRIIPLILLFHSNLNLTNQKTRFSGCLIGMYFGSGRFHCYMTSQTENAATTSLYGTSNVLSPGYRLLPSARQCVLPSIESFKAYKQLCCLNSLKKCVAKLSDSNL